MPSSIKEQDSNFFTTAGSLDYSAVFKNPYENHLLDAQNISVSQSIYPAEIIQCKEFKPNQFAILGLLDALKQFWNLGKSLGTESSSENEKQESSTKIDVNEFTEKQNKLVEVKNKVARYGKLAYTALLETISPLDTTTTANGDAITQSAFITGIKRSKIPPTFKRLDLFYDLPQYFYKNLSSGKYGRSFNLPITNYSSYLESSSEGQYTVGDTDLGGVQSALDKLIGKTAQMGLPIGLTWEGKNTYTTIKYSLNLYNSNSANLEQNLKFINNIIAGNMWAHQGVFKSPSSVYDVIVASRHKRLYYCTGSFVCEYEGKIRRKSIMLAEKDAIAQVTPPNYTAIQEANQNFENTLNEKLASNNKKLQAKLSELTNTENEINAEFKAKVINKELIASYKAAYAKLQTTLENAERVTVDQKTANVIISQHIIAYYKQIEQLLNAMIGLLTEYEAEMQKYKPFKLQVTEPAKPATYTEAERETRMNGDGTVTTYVTKPKELKDAAVPAKTKVTTDENPIIEKIRDLNETLDDLNKIAKAIIAKSNDSTYTTAVDTANKSDNGGTTLPPEPQYSESSINTIDSIVDDPNAISNSEIIECLNEMESIQEEYNQIKTSSNYTKLSQDELDNISNEDGLYTEKLKKIHDSDTEANNYKQQIATIQEQKEATNAHFNKIKAKIQEELARVNKQLKDSVVTFTPSLTHIPDIFKFDVSFTSLLPNNFNLYLYSIEDSIKDYPDHNFTNNTRINKFASFMSTFNSNYTKLLTNSSNTIENTVTTTDGKKITISSDMMADSSNAEANTKLDSDIQTLKNKFLLDKSFIDDVYTSYSSKLETALSLLTDEKLNYDLKKISLKNDKAIQDAVKTEEQNMQETQNYYGDLE